VTDTGILPPDKSMSDGVENLFGLLKACGKTDTAASLLKEYESGNRKYAPLKEAVADALVETINPMRLKREELSKDKDAVMKSIREMSAKARETAHETVREARKLTGLPAYL
jgi:tryptophanyl-tRNA synthetase